MPDPSKWKSLVKLALRHLCLAVKILDRVCRLGGGDLSPPAAKTLPKADELAGEFPVAAAAATDQAAADRPQASSFILDEPTADELNAGDYLTFDRVEIRGRVGTDENREVKINFKPPVRLDRREHAVLTMLARLARCAAIAAKTGGKPLPAFLPVRVMVAIIDGFCRPGGRLAGRWPYPMEADIHRTVHKLRGRLGDLGFNPNLIESGQRFAGYRLSTPPSKISVDPAEDAFWTALFYAVLRAQAQRGSGEEGAAAA